MGICTGDRTRKECNIPAKNLTCKFVMERSEVSGGEAAYKMMEIAGKGRGLVASRTLKIGELVVSEQLFLKLPSGSEYDVSSFCHLTTEVQEKLMNLSCPSTFKDCEATPAEILQMKFLTNCISVNPENEKAADSAVFETISMINHSCIPNVAWFTEEEDATRKEVRVCKRIEEGEEIVASYIGLNQLPLRQQRREMLMPTWDFVCRLRHSSY